MRKYVRGSLISRFQNNVYPHSCAPTAAVVWRGFHLVVIALVDIHTDDEVSVSGLVYSGNFKHDYNNLGRQLIQTQTQGVLSLRPSTVPVLSRRPTQTQRAKGVLSRRPRGQTFHLPPSRSLVKPFTFQAKGQEDQEPIGSLPFGQGVGDQEVKPFTFHRPGKGVLSRRPKGSLVGDQPIGQEEDQEPSGPLAFGRRLGDYGPSGLGDQVVGGTASGGVARKTQRCECDLCVRRLSNPFLDAAYRTAYEIPSKKERFGYKIRAHICALNLCRAYSLPIALTAMHAYMLIQTVLLRRRSHTDSDLMQLVHTAARIGVDVCKVFGSNDTNYMYFLNLL